MNHPIFRIVRTLTFTLLLLALVLAGGSCKKYPDGPSFSLLPKAFRLEGNWRKNQIFRNGVDVTSAYLATTVSESYNIQKGGSYSYSGVFSNGSISYTGTWAFSSDKTVLYISYYLGNSYQNDVYLILRLKEHDLWMRQVDQGGNVYEYHFLPN